MSPLGYTQENYRLALTTPLGDNKLLIDHVDGEESISGLFVFHLRMLSEDHALVFADIVGKEVCLTNILSDGTEQFVYGIVGRFRQAGTTARFTTYFAELYPPLWLLTKTTDSRIFQNKSIPDIVKQVLSDHGITTVTDSLTASYSPREYIVQYQETAFDFISRLMEREGIFYWFNHTSAACTMVLVDDGANYVAGPPLLSVTGTDTTRADLGQVPECSLQAQVTTNQFKLDDYNFETPSTDLLGVVSGTSTTLTRYEYPADESAQSAVEAVATRRLEEVEVAALTLEGTSVNPSLRPGRTFTLGDHQRDDANAEYVVWRVTHQATQDLYSNSFEAFPIGTKFRPRRITPRPRIYGCQTALVVGKSGEEIWTDQYGRIKVKFYWDQSAPQDETSSCWVRVAQGWAGKQWGAFFLPRIGQEVIVTFLDGDPDRPLVTGGVYNAQQTVPYTLPDDQTRSTIKSNSSKGGAGFNEIRFEDKAGSEEVFVQAQKDMLVTILNDQTVTVKQNRTVTIEEAKDTLTVSKGERAVSVKGNETHDNGAKLTYTIKEDMDMTVGGKLTVTVTGDLTLTVSGNVTIKSDGSVSQKAGTDFTQEAGANLTSKSGANQNVEAGAVLVLKGATVKIN